MCENKGKIFKKAIEHIRFTKFVCASGGAERLVVDAAISLQERKHHVEIFTAYHNPEHAFPETCNGNFFFTQVKPKINSMNVFLLFFGGGQGHWLFMCMEISFHQNCLDSLLF